MMIVLKLSLALFLIAWIAFGIWLIVKYERLFGPHRDDPAETSGARSLGIAHVAAVWLGFFALAVYFLLK